MTRPLTGAREVFRRLQENQEARRRRTNEVRQMGGLEPLEEPAPQEQWYTNYLAERLYRAAGIPQYAIWGNGHTEAAGNNYRDYNLQRLQREVREAATDRLHQVMQMDIPEAPRLNINTIRRNPGGFIPGTVQMIEGATAPIEPIRVRDWATADNTYPTPYTNIWHNIEEDWDKPYERKMMSNKDRVMMKEFMGPKLKNNDDFSFLLNKDD
jgi:hypothetical protein